MGGPASARAGGSGKPDNQRARLAATPPVADRGGADVCSRAWGVGYTLLAPTGYAATATVSISPTGAEQAQQSTAGRAVAGAVINLDTEAQLVTSETVAMLAAHLMHSPLPSGQLSSGVTVAVPPNSATLDISCHAPTAAGAATCANAFAEAYLQSRDAYWRKQARGSWGMIITHA